MNVEQLFDLSGKVVIITGAAGNLGSRYADGLSQFGANVVLADIDYIKCKQMAKKIKEKYLTDPEPIKLDLTKKKSISNMVSKVLKKYSKIDVLINNASNNAKVESVEKDQNFSRLENFDLEKWNQDMAVGLTGAFLCSKHFGFAISKNSNGGSIINISSDLGVIAPDQQIYQKKGLTDEQQMVKPVSYSVVKTGLIGLTRYLATYWALKNVRCNALCPGGILNDHLTDDFLKNMHQRIPMGRMANVDDYKSAIVFMISDASSYLNGAILSIDGGRSVW